MFRLLLLLYYVKLLSTDLQKEQDMALFRKPKQNKFELHEVVESSNLVGLLPVRYWFVEYDGIQSGDLILDETFAKQLIQWLNRTNVEIALEDRQYLIKVKGTNKE